MRQFAIVRHFGHYHRLAVVCFPHDETRRTQSAKPRAGPGDRDSGTRPAGARDAAGRRGISGLAYRGTARPGSDRRGPAFVAAIDGRRAAAGDDERGHQHGDRAVPDQRALVAAAALRLVVAGWFAVDAVRYAFDSFAAASGTNVDGALAALANVAVVLLILLARGWLATWVVAVAGALRIFGITWNIIVAPVYTTAEADETIVAELGLADQPEAAAMAAEVEAAERTRAPIDRAWTLSFIVTLFAIHLGRMSTELTLLGLLSPAVAVAGDMLIAVLITLLVINPAYLLWRGPTRWIERRLWRWHLNRADPRSLLDRPRSRRLASLETDDGDSPARAALLGTGGAQPGAADVGSRLPPSSPRPFRSGG